MRNASYQIVQTRYSGGAIVEDTWPVLYAIEGQAIEDFKQQGPAAMFENTDEPETDYFIRELDADFISTGRTVDI